MMLRKSVIAERRTWRASAIASCDKTSDRLFGSQHNAASAPAYLDKIDAASIP
jgi:hypothetical protein